MKQELDEYYYSSSFTERNELLCDSSTNYGSLILGYDGRKTKDMIIQKDYLYLQVKYPCSVILVLANGHNERNKQAAAAW